MDYYLTKCQLVAGAMSILNAKDGACLTYYMGNIWSDDVTAGLLVWFPSERFNASVHFGSYELALRIGTDPVLKALWLGAV